MFARVAQWWSIALPRRGSRVRIPSRALNDTTDFSSALALAFFYRIFKTTYMLNISESITKLLFEIGHLMTSSFGVICSQMFNPVCKQPSVSKLTPFCFHSVLTAFSLVGQALTLLVAVSSMCYHTSTPALSTSSSSRGFTPFGWDISS